MLRDLGGCFGWDLEGCGGLEVELQAAGSSVVEEVQTTGSRGRQVMRLGRKVGPNHRLTWPGWGVSLGRQ